MIFVQLIAPYLSSSCMVHCTNYLPCRRYPGEGKTTLALALAASLSTGKPLWNEMPTEPASVIYQTAEDGLADTVRPRLDAMGADCSNVFVIDESQKCLSLSDKRIEDAIESVHAKLFILAPIQILII